jgi:hypothetical protein
VSSPPRVALVLLAVTALTGAALARDRDSYGPEPPPRQGILPPLSAPVPRLQWRLPDYPSSGYNRREDYKERNREREWIDERMRDPRAPPVYRRWHWPQNYPRYPVARPRW